MKYIISITLALWSALWPAMLQGAPQSQRPEQADAPVKLRADMVSLDAEVLLKKTGHAAQGLTKEDFVVYEDNVPQYVTDFSQDKLPLSVVLALDVSSSIAPLFADLRAAAAHALQQLKPVDEVALMAFGGTTRVVAGLTTDKQLIADELETTDGTGLERGTNINEAIYQAAGYLQKYSPPLNRRVILAITDDISTQTTLSPSESGVLARLHESGSVVCGLLFFNSLRNTRFAMVSGSVRGYANETGGALINADKKRLEADLGELVQRLRTRYSLGYFSTNEKRDGKFHKVRVELSPQAQARGLKVEIITRKGYKAASATPRK